LHNRSIVITDRGMLRLGDIVKERVALRVSDGAGSQHVYDWAKFEARDTVFIRTRRKLELEGSLTHRVMLANGEWKPLSEIAVGDRLKLARGTNLWASEYQRLSWAP